jgi:predicted kinase
VLTVITGPPCSGKSTYAREHAEPGDILIDYDLMAQALGSTSPHDHPDPVRWVTIAARRAAIGAAIAQHRQGATVWIVQTRIAADEMGKYRDAGAEIVTLTADAEVLHARASAERPARWHQLIDEWHPEAPARQSRATNRHPDANTRRGRRGRPWRRARQQVLAASRTCWICGHGGADSADHVTPLVDGGDALDPDNLAPAHYRPCPTCGRRCNTAKGRRPGRAPAPTQGEGGQSPIASSTW